MPSSRRTITISIRGSGSWKDRPPHPHVRTTAATTTHSEAEGGAGDRARLGSWDQVTGQSDSGYTTWRRWRCESAEQRERDDDCAAIALTPRDDLSLDIRRVEGRVSTVRGAIDADSAPIIRHVLNDLTEGQGNVSVDVDLSGVTFVGTAVLALRCRAQRTGRDWSLDKGFTPTVATRPR
jgi:hypothetical protein